MKEFVTVGFFLCAIALLVTGCAAQAPETVIATAPGFFAGLWHGFIAPVAFVGHLFDSSIAVYSVPNNGGWYSFGFLLGVGTSAGGTYTATR